MCLISPTLGIWSFSKRAAKRRKTGAEIFLNYPPLFFANKKEIVLLLRLFQSGGDSPHRAFGIPKGRQ